MPRRHDLAPSAAGRISSRRLARSNRSGRRSFRSAWAGDAVSVGVSPTVPHTFIRITPSESNPDTAVVRINIVDPLLRLDAKDALCSSNLPALPPPPAHVLTPAVYEEIVDPGGMANVGYALQQESARRRIGTMIAGNSGRPGGACGQPDGTVTHLHAGHTTQEEDMVSNWLLTVAHGPEQRSAVYRATMHNRWGMIHPEATVVGGGGPGGGGDDDGNDGGGGSEGGFGGADGGLV